MPHLGRRARAAARALATLRTAPKDAWLRRAADALAKRTPVTSSPPTTATWPPPRQRADRGPDRPPAAHAGADQGRRRRAARGGGAARPGRRGASRRASGPTACEVHKVGVPLGVIFFIYESRPNVTVDAAGAVRQERQRRDPPRRQGGARTPTAPCTASWPTSCRACGLPADAVQLVDTTDRDGRRPPAASCTSSIDLAIPRGGEGLIRRVAAEATMPVLKHYKGNCHVYVDRAADLDMAERDRRQRQVPAAGRVQRGREPAGPPRRRRRRSCRASARRLRERRRRAARLRRRPRRLVPSATPATRRGLRAPSSST